MKFIKKIIIKLLLTPEAMNVFLAAIICGSLITLYNTNRSYWEHYIAITTFTSFILAFLASKMSDSIASYVAKLFEGSFDKVAYTYPRNVDEFTSYYNEKTGEKFVFPITIEKMIEPESVIEIIDSQKMYELPQKINENFNEIMKVHLSSTVFNQLNIRLDKILSEGNVITLNTSRTTFFNSLVTNRAMDYKFADHLTVRELYCYGPFLPSLEESHFSNHLGFNIFIKTSDDYFVFIKRGAEVSIAKNSLGCGVSASLKSKYALNDDREFTLEGLRSAIAKEFLDELNIEEAEESFMLNKNCNIVAFYRDWIEGGKPQFLIYVELKLTKDEVEESFYKSTKQKKKKRKVKSSKDFIVDILSTDREVSKVAKMNKDGSDIVFISQKDFDELEILMQNSVKMGNKTHTIIPTTVGLIVAIKRYLASLPSEV